MTAEAHYRALLDDLHGELKATRDSLAGVRCDAPVHKYIFYCTSQIAALLDGYVCLRRAALCHASKHLIRPAIESVFRIHAVRNSPESFYRIAFSEFQEDKKWARSGPPAQSQAVLQHLETQWATFKKEYATIYPAHARLDSALSYWDLASIGGIQGYYSTFYRLYSRFTHGALRATSGSMDEFQVEDDPTMALCALSCIEALVSIGAKSPHLDSLKARFHPDEPTGAEL